MLLSSQGSEAEMTGLTASYVGDQKTVRIPSVSFATRKSSTKSWRPTLALITAGLSVRYGGVTCAAEVR